MTKWFSVVTDPLGLAGFAIFAITVFFAKTKAVKSLDQWTRLGIVALGLVCAVGGVSIAILNASATDIASKGTFYGPITQSSSGCSNAIVAGGNVSVRGNGSC